MIQEDLDFLITHQDKIFDGADVNEPDLLYEFNVKE
jgi:hypothetical protein